MVVGVRRRWSGQRCGRNGEVGERRWCGAGLLEIHSRGWNRCTEDGDDEPVAAEGTRNCAWVVGGSGAMSASITLQAVDEGWNNLKANQWCEAFDYDDYNQ